MSRARVWFLEGLPTITSIVEGFGGVPSYSGPSYTASTLGPSKHEVNGIIYIDFAMFNVLTRLLPRLILNTCLILNTHETSFFFLELVVPVRTYNSLIFSLFVSCCGIGGTKPIPT